MEQESRDQKWRWRDMKDVEQNSEAITPPDYRSNIVDAEASRADLQSQAETPSIAPTVGPPEGPRKELNDQDHHSTDTEQVVGPVSEIGERTFDTTFDYYSSLRSDHSSTTRSSHTQTRESQRLSREHPLVKWHAFARAWRLSDLPQPNTLLTVNFPRAKLDARLAAGETVSSYRKDLVDDIRRIVTDGENPWLSMWVLETRNHPHFHLVLWLPEPKKLISPRIAAWAENNLGFQSNEGRSEVQTLWDTSNGQPVQLKSISNEFRHKASGHTGFQGLVEYLAKEIGKNHGRRRGRRLGKLVGASQAIIPLVDMYGYRLPADDRYLGKPDTALAGPRGLSSGQSAKRSILIDPRTPGILQPSNGPTIIANDDIQRMAKSFLDEFGSAAAAKARQIAEGFRIRNDIDGMRICYPLVRAIDELAASRPESLLRH